MNWNSSVNACNAQIIMLDVMVTWEYRVLIIVVTTERVDAAIEDSE